MSTPQLTVRYIPDDQYIGELKVTVDSRGYCGTGVAWFDKEDLKQRFVTALRAYPLSAASLPSIESGYLSKTYPKTLDQCHVRISVRPYNTQGLLLVQTDLATEFGDTPDGDCQQTITTRFLTEYALLGAFALDLAQLLDGKRDYAVLTGRQPGTPIRSVRLSNTPQGGA